MTGPHILLTCICDVLIVTCIHLFLFNKARLLYLFIALNLQVDAVTGETRTFSDILTRSLSVAECLHARGVTVGDVVGVCSENNLDFILPVLASYYIGATCAPLNPNYTTRKYQKEYISWSCSCIKLKLVKQNLFPFKCTVKLHKEHTLKKTVHYILPVVLVHQ
jgi:acyl-CoA synthetase (AMP-forming)/AMP-acid ligase II